MKKKTTEISQKQARNDIYIQVILPFSYLKISLDRNFISVPEAETFVIVQHTGAMDWLFPAITTSACKMNIQYFPFDTQQCVLTFYPWTLDESKVRGERCAPKYYLNLIGAETKMMKKKKKKYKKEKKKKKKKERKKRERKKIKKILMGNNSSSSFKKNFIIIYYIYHNAVCQYE